VFENRELRRMFRPKREDVAGGWRTLRNKELHNMFASAYIIITVIKSRRVRWVGHIAHMEEMKNDAYKILVRKPERKIPVGRPRRS
jgi:hypothetical protein